MLMAISVASRDDPSKTDLYLAAPLKKQPQGASGSFIALGSDFRTWRVKPLNNWQWPEICISELLVSKLGQLIEAPVCNVEPMWIGEDVRGWDFRNGRLLEPGFAAASLEVPETVEERALAHRDEDDNKRRHVGIYALRDWCVGEDDQWLYQGSTQNSVFSHDHGFYLYRGRWSALDLGALVNTSHTLPNPPAGLDQGTISATSARLRGLTTATVSEVMAAVPKSWPVADTDLEKMGQFLLDRAPLVADRLEELLP